MASNSGSFACASVIGFEVFQSLVAEHLTQGVARCGAVADLLEQSGALPIGIDDDFGVGAVEGVDPLPVGDRSFGVVLRGFDPCEPCECIGRAGGHAFL